MHVQVLLLDEVTVDMDVVARLDLLEFFRSGTTAMCCANISHCTCTPT